jgi:hypothetical protein
MNKEFYQEKILKPLEVWKVRGDDLHAKGARLIGHVPEIAPKAYVHIIFPPLKEECISEFRERLSERVLPDSFLNLLRMANGLYLFPEGITIYGYIPLKKVKSTSFLDSPSNIMIDNGQLMVKGSNASDITIGWYQSDASYINIKPDGSIVRFKPAVPIQIIQIWPDLEVWISSEIERLNMELQEKLARIENSNFG